MKHFVKHVLVAICCDAEITLAISNFRDGDQNLKI